MASVDNKLNEVKEFFLDVVRYNPESLLRISGRDSQENLRLGGIFHKKRGDVLARVFGEHEKYSMPVYAGDEAVYVGNLVFDEFSGKRNIKNFYFDGGFGHLFFIYSISDEGFTSTQLLGKLDEGGLVEKFKSLI